MTTRVTVRFDRKLHSRLKEIALKQKTTLSALAEKALLFYLIEDDDCRIALRRLRDRNDLVISCSDLRKRLRFLEVNHG